MKRLLMVALLLTGCEVGPDVNRSDDAIIRRAQAVRFCRDGTAIGQDPVTKRLVWSRWSGSGVLAADVALGDVCQ